MRIKCQNCNKVQVACYCHSIHEFQNSKKIIILKHPSEENHPLGTANMAKLTFDNIEIIVGEDFSKNLKLKELIINTKCALFKPESSAQPYELTHSSFETLFFIDGTWKKANKIFFLNPFLQQLPLVTFQKDYKSIYRLRKEPKENYLSTFETIVKSFEISENRDLQHLLEPLELVQNFQESNFKL